MKRLLRLFLMSALLMTAAGSATAQSTTTHKVKKGETIYGIAHAHGLTEEQLRRANPGMESADYVLKKGSVILIPQVGSATGLTSTPAETSPTTTATSDVRTRAIRMGVCLPLHNQSGDGRRMVEYYRGLLMACDSLRHEGISVDVYAWNTPSDADLTPTLQKAAAARCDLIVGPLYSRQMDQLSAFCQQHGTMLLIPFSITAPQLSSNPHIFQVYQPDTDLDQSTSRRFSEWFRDYNVIIVNCEDPASTKGSFTAALRRQLDQADHRYVLTSLNASDAGFSSAFSQQRRNVVVLNTAREEDLRVAFVKLNGILALQPGLQVTLFGYPEWMRQADELRASFHRFDVYIPAPYFTNVKSPLYQQLQRRYRANFNTGMIDNMPRFAMTGFDHGLFFLRGLHKYGATFDGARERFGYQPVQTPLRFERVDGGGYQNRAFMFIHFKPDNQIETLSY